MMKFISNFQPKPPVIMGYAAAVLSDTAALIIARFLDILVKPSLLAIGRFFVILIHRSTVETMKIPRILIFSLALVATSAVAQIVEENPRTIRVVMDSAYAPYSFRSADGKLQGILIDQWHAWEKKTGINVEIHAMDWSEAVRRTRAGEFDVIDGIVETPERRNYFDFTPGYTPIEASIFFRNDISGITDLASLRGFPVGVKAGDQHINRLEENGVKTVILFPNDDAIIEAAKQRKINVFVVDDPSALYLLNKMGIDGEFRQSAPIFRDELRRAVRKGDGVLLRTVSEGFAAIKPGELKQIDEKWFGRTINMYRRYFAYAAYAAAVTILLIAGLVGWNRTLKKRILQRTAALGESEQRFRQIADNIREVFWLTTVDFSNVLYISPAYEAVWGRSRESLYREPRSFFAAIHPDDRARVGTVIDRNRVQGFEVEYRVVRPDGSIRLICDRRFPIRDDSGRFYRVAGIAEDITERKQAEGLLHAKEREFRAIVENAPDQIIRYDRAFRRTYVNPAVAQSYGLPVETLIDKPLGSGTVEAGLDVKDDELAQFRQRIAAVFDTGKSSEFENSWPMPTGRRYYSIRLFPELDLNGSVINVLGIARDTTERKQAEDALRQSDDHLRLVIDTIPTMAWSLGPDGVLDFVNQRWLDYTGLSFEEAIEKPTRTVHPEDLSRVMEKWLVVKPTSEAYEDEMRLQRADGEYRWFLVRTAPLLDKQGNLLNRYGVAIDIEERKQVEWALNERLRFETLVTELSAAFANLSPNEVEREIDRWLQSLVEFLGVDRASFLQFVEDWTTLYRTHSYTVPGIEPLPPPPLGLKDQFLWITDQLRQGVTIKWSRIPDDMPEEAAQEKEFAAKLGVKSGLYIPVLMGGSVICAISFTSIVTYRDWPDAMVARLRLVGEIFAAAVERKRAEAALRKSEQQFRQMAENIREVFWMRTPDFGSVLYISPAYESLWGRTCESLYRDPRSFIDGILPEDRANVVDVIDRVREQGFEVEYRVVRPDGSIRWICDRGFPIKDDSGRFYRVAGFAEDITERKRAEEETHRHAARLEARAEISQALAKVGLDVRTVLDTIARYTAEVIGDGCVIRLLSCDEQWLESAAFHHPKAETMALMKSLHTGTPIAASHEWFGHVLRTRQPLLVPIVNQERLRQIVSPEYLPFVEQVGLHSILILPLCVEGRVIGTLSLTRNQPGHSYTSADQVFLQHLADRAALTIHNAQLFEQVQSAHQRLQSLSRSLLEVQETERRHIARELHDEIGQVLTGIKLSLEKIAREPPDCIKSTVSQALGLATELIGRVRNMSLDLRPAMLDDLGLLPALTWQFGRYTSQFEIRVNFKHSRLAEQRFAPNIETAAYRIVQEALTNVARHAGVGAVDVDIQADESEITIRIRDEGVGFDAHTLSAGSTGGLSGMRERAVMLGGRLDIASVPGAGTRLTAELPLRMREDNP